MAHQLPQEMANEYYFDKINQNDEALPDEIMSNRLSFDGKSSQYASTSIAVYAKNMKQEVEEEQIDEKFLQNNDDETLSDVDDTMNRYRMRYSKKNSTGSLSNTHGKKVTIQEPASEDEAPQSLEKLITKKDQNIKISNLLKKNHEKLLQREADEKVHYDPSDDTLTLNESKIDREIQSNERFIRDNLPSSKYSKKYEYDSNQSGSKPNNAYSDSLVKMSHKTNDIADSPTKVESSPELKPRNHEPQSNYMKYLLKKQESQNSNINIQKSASPHRSESPDEFVKKSWEHPKFKNLQKKYEDERAEMKELEKLEYQKKSDLVKRSLEIIEKEHEYLTVNIDTRHSKMDSYAETSVENTFRQKNDTSMKKTNTYMDTDDRKDHILDSVESRSKSRSPSKSRSLSKSDIEASRNIRNELSSDKKNSTIKEASASNLEETLNIGTEFHDRMDDSRNRTHQIEPYRRPYSIQEPRRGEIVNHLSFRHTEQKNKVQKVVNGLTTMESIEPYVVRVSSVERDQLTMGQINQGSVPTSGQVSLAQLQLLNQNSSKKQMVNVFYPQKEPSLEEAPYVKSFPGKDFASSEKKFPKKEQDSLLKFEVPDGNLMAVCIIKSLNKGKNAALERSRLNEKRFGGSRQSSARSNSMANIDSKRRSNFLDHSRAPSGRSHGSKRSISGIHRKLPNLGNTASSNLDLSIDLDLLPRKNESSSLQFFTTHCQASHVVMKQQFEERVSEKMIKSLLRYDVDVNKFLMGLYEDEGNLRLYQFDKCISENQHTRGLTVESWQYLRAWLIHSRVQSEQQEQPLKFCFLFGSQETQKSDMLNLMNSNSLLQDFLKELRDPIAFLKITMFFQDQEFILNSREFNNTKQSKREIGMEIREALRDRTRLVQKLTQQQPNLAIYIQKCSHFRIQINNYVFIDMADLGGLQFHEDPEVVQTLTNDFGSMTNEILRQSKFYENHDFQLNQEQETSAFNGFLRENITPSSKVLLLTFINNDPEDESSSSIALDFSHKIRQYYQGNSDECIISQIINENQYERENIMKSYQKLAMIFSKLQKMKKRVNRELLKAEKQFNQNVSFQNVQQKIQSHKKFQDLFNQFREFVQQAIYEDLSVIFDSLHMAFIESQIATELDSIQICMGQLEKLIEHKNPGLISATSKLIVEPFPKKSRGRSSKATSLPRVDSLGRQKGSFSSSFGGPNVHSSQQFKSNSNINAQPIQKSSSGKIKTVTAPYGSKKNNVGNILDKKTLNQLANLSSKMMKKKMSALEQNRASSRLSYGNKNRADSTRSNHRSNSINKVKKKGKVNPNQHQSRPLSSNEDIPIESMREKLSQDIDRTLSSLKRKRSTINLENGQATEFRSNLLSDSQVILDQSVQSENTMQIQNFNHIYKMQDQSTNRASVSSRGQPQKSKKSKKRKSKSKQKQEYRDISPQFDLPEKQPNPFKESVVKTDYSVNTNIMEHSTAKRNNIHEVKSLKSEITRLKQQLLFQQEEHKTQMQLMDLELQNKEGQILGYQQKNTDAERKIAKLNKNSTKQEDQEKIADLQQRFDEMKHLKEKSDQLNKQILQQVSLMKDTIKDSQAREKLNIQLLEKNKEKNEKIQQLKSNQESLVQSIKAKDQQISKLKDKVSTLEGFSSNQVSLSEENQELKAQLQMYKSRATEKEQDRYSVEDLIEKNDALERARDKFRNQTLDQKQEIKKLKQKLETATLKSSQSLKASFQESAVEERPMRKITPKQVDRKVDQRRDSSDETKSDQENQSQPRNRKNEVIKDIKSLIKQLK